MLEGRGAILETARRVSEILRARGGPLAVVGGVAVSLHGHARATEDVDVYVGEDAEGLAGDLEKAGFVFDSARREFVGGGVAVQFVRPRQVPVPPSTYMDIDGIRTVSLADLIAMKLRSGTANLLRAQDLADVIALMRVHGLGKAYAARLSKELRPAFRKLADAMAREGRAEESTDD